MGRFVVGLGTFGAVLLTAGCLGFYEGEVPQQQVAGPEIYDQPRMQEQRAYRPVPRPKPRPAMTASAVRTSASPGKDAGGKKFAKAEVPMSETASKPLFNANEKPVEVKPSAKTPDAGAASGTETSVAKASASGPVTPAEIRTAVPVQKLDNPKQALAGVEVKSVWGGVLGHVSSLDVSAGKIKTLDIKVMGSPGAKSKVVRVEPSRLKYMRNRKMVLTTLSKPDLEKLPATANP